MGIVELNNLMDRAASLDSFYSVVQKFHQAVDHPDGHTTQFLLGEEKARRIAWMQEELEEFKQAKTLTDQADAMGDLLWFVVGTMVCMGVEPSLIMKPITKANMSKIMEDGKVRRRESDGKVQKPDGWQTPEPEIANNIRMKHCVNPEQIMIPDDSVVS